MSASRREFLAGAAAAALSGAGAAPVKRFARFEAPARELLAKMTLDEKVGQMTQPDQQFLQSLDDIEKYHLGSLLSGGDSDPKSGNDLASWTDMYDRYQERAMKTRLHIPLLYGVDAVHGHSNVLGAVIFPHNIGLGCTRNAALVERVSRITADEVRATGINWAFSPCVTAPQDPRWGRTYEGFSENPDVVKTLGAAAVRGLQNGHVLACAKHFAGDGGTTFGTGMKKLVDRGDTRVDEATLRRVHLQGYITAIAEGVGSIMPSYSSWNGVKCSGSKRLLTEILKDELGFEGFLISDYNALGELPGTYKEQIEQSINAGMDMVMVPDKYPQFFENLKALATEGKVPMSRIDDAVLRILKVKVAMGLMDPRRSQLADRKLHKDFGSPERRKVARQCVRESMVVLKNSGGLLPLKKGARVKVAGKCADDMGNQCGGWTITWQGKSGPVTTGGTTISQGIRAVAGEGNDVGIAVIGETPYAEFKGDRADLKMAPEDVAVVDSMKAAGMKVVAVIVSGRPLVLDPILDKADAIVAAWLPGSEGAGVADVLFGDYKPTGKLSMTWSKDWPFGYGLSF